MPMDLRNCFFSILSKYHMQIWYTNIRCHIQISYMVLHLIEDNQEGWPQLWTAPRFPRSKNDPENPSLSLAYGITMSQWLAPFPTLIPVVSLFIYIYIVARLYVIVYIHAIIHICIHVYICNYIITYNYSCVYIYICDYIHKYVIICNYIYM